MLDGITCVGDMTDHGGVVLEGFAGTDLNGRQIAGCGHMVSCPRCQGVFPIIEGNAAYTISSVPVAQHGMKTACGATLIAGNPQARITR
ncbi:PAAR domain-containing protein [Cupriavidus sp. BIC8F]|uniref:PAAR domain-containing protein n=1 Tax=Cupriavidus sp. BIC8F TaxID=3079014 RepID=UPI002916607A|nr:PAAR domain-containing protein [Cupriavidus sp. BIC8F]